MQKIVQGIDVKGFRLVEQIGIGSAGEVWQGTDGETTVAIKFLNIALLQDKKRDIHLYHFRNEALALKHVSDLVHIPTHIHHELKVERPYIVMEFIESPSFATLMARGEMMFVPLPQRLNALYQLAQTLSTVHKHGIIHRDIKPGNMHGMSHPYLLDFSIGIPIKDSESADRHVGTPLYLTPDLLPPSARTDNYAFAVVTYELLFGQHPIFDYRNVPENTADLRKQAGQAILNETWYQPKKLPASDLPLNLKGADLDHLTQIFQNAFLLTDDRYTDTLVFIDDILSIVQAQDNIPYIDNIPSPTEAVSGEQFSNIEHFTDHLVSAYTASTDLPDLENGDINVRQWIMGLTVLFVVLFVVIILLVAVPSG